MDQIPELHSPLSPISESPSSPAYSTGKLAEGVGNVCGLFLHQQFRVPMGARQWAQNRFSA